jgi:lipopolysaccharide biosynthesis glycosyltransferase
MNDINICLACDDNYAKHACVVMASALANAAPDDKLAFFILDGGISSENRDKISSIVKSGNGSVEFVSIDEKLFVDYLKIRTHDYITLPTYYRLKITSLLPQLSRVIYFDCDVVVNSSLAELFNVEMGDLPIAGVNDLNRRRVRENPTYVNAGVLVVDFDNIRRLKAEDRFLEYTRQKADVITCGDQEIINEVCRDKIKIVDERWNVQSSNFVNRSSYTSKPRVVHFVAKNKPWHGKSLSVHRDLYFKYLQMTPWALPEDELEQFCGRGSKKQLWISFFKHRPLFWLRPRFYKAWYKSVFCD